MEHSKKAYELFMAGYNCSQSVFAAFCDVTGVDEDTALRLSSSFGGGIGRLREVCGALSGMLMAAGALYGYDTPGDDVQKAAHYALVQALAGQFREAHSTILCRELLNRPGPESPTPEARTPDYYASRPCARFVGTAARILEEYMAKHPPKER